MMYNVENASPELVRAIVGSDCGSDQESQEHISVMAHDVWAVGCLLASLVTGSGLFKAQSTGLTFDQRAAAVAQQHRRWVCLCCALCP